jgi:hypothetical protein
MRPGLALLAAAAVPRGKAAKPDAPMALAVIVSARRRDTMVALQSKLPAGDPSQAQMTQMTMTMCGVGVSCQRRDKKQTN